MRSRRRRPSHSGEIPVAWLPWSLLQETIGCSLSKDVVGNGKVDEVAEGAQAVKAEVIEVDVASITATSSTTSPTLVVEHLKLRRELIRRVPDIGIES